MSDYKTDEEKAEELKAWWKENGTSVVAGVALAIAALFGWEYWQKYQVETAEAASTLYLESREAESPEAAAQKRQQLRDDYSGSPYAALASLQTAKTHAEAGEYPQAAEALQWVIDNDKDAGHVEVARLRLARVNIAMGEYDKALALVDGDYAESYESLREELRGDIYTAQNQPEEARKAYQRALQTNGGGSSEFIQMKLDNLGQ
ncbi:MAG: tetratricopeptide repeat protein [Thiolinea sp.]